MGRTGLRWGEARALQVADFVEVPTPGVMVRRNQPEGIERKRPKGGRSRRVPLANRVLAIVRELAHDKAPHELLLTTSSGAMLHRTVVLRALRWEKTGQGRRVPVDHPPRRPDHGPSVVRARVHRNDEPVPALPRNGCRCGRTRTPQQQDGVPADRRGRLLGTETPA
jgi:hypothetical protein